MNPQGHGLPARQIPRRVRGVAGEPEALRRRPLPARCALPFPACDLDGDGDCDDRTFRDSWNASAMPDDSKATSSQQYGPDTDPDIDPWIEGGSQYEAVRREVRRDVWQPVIKKPVTYFGLRFYFSIAAATLLYAVLLRIRIKRGFLKPSQERTSPFKFK